jgi:hypothetical protein
MFDETTFRDLPDFNGIDQLHWLRLVIAPAATIEPPHLIDQEIESLSPLLAPSASSTWTDLRPRTHQPCLIGFQQQMPRHSPEHP